METKMNHNPEFESSLAAFRADDAQPEAEMWRTMPTQAGLAGLPPPITDRSIDDLLAEKSLHVLHAGILRWRVRCRRLELQVDRLEQEVRMASALKDADSRLIARLRAERDRLREAVEHARGFLEWGMGDE